MKAAKRNKLPKKKFALPSKRKYPIDTKARARNALARAASDKNEGDYATIRRAVLQAWPSLKQDGKKK